MNCLFLSFWCYKIEHIGKILLLLSISGEIGRKASGKVLSFFGSAEKKKSLRNGQITPKKKKNEPTSTGLRRRCSKTVIEISSKNTATSSQHKDTSISNVGENSGEPDEKLDVPGAAEYQAPFGGTIGEASENAASVDDMSQELQELPKKKGQELQELRDAIQEIREEIKNLVQTVAMHLATENEDIKRE